MQNLVKRKRCANRLANIRFDALPDNNVRENIHNIPSISNDPLVSIPVERQPDKR